MTHDKLSSPAALRNRDPILDVLRRILPSRGVVLEIASGSGEHVVHFAQHLPGLTFQPSDQDVAARRSIAAYVAESGLENIKPPVAINASESNWPINDIDAMICVNMIHISPRRATEGLMHAASALLRPGCPLYLYGPYRRQGIVTAPSNEAFDQSLRERDPSWGLRALEDVAALAKTAGFSDAEIIDMPANNLSVIFRKL